MKKQNRFLIAMLIVGFVYACAESNYFGRLAKRTTTNTPDDVVKVPTNVPPGGNPDLSYFDVTGTWSQPTNVGSLARPEIIFNVDVSGSMADEINALKNSLTGWVAQLESQNVLDFCLGVIRAQVSPSGAGKLIAGSHGKKCICTYGDNSVSSSTAVTQLGQTLDSALGASGGGQNEAMIYSSNVALTNSGVLDENQDAGCFREDASAVFILVSDENDAGYSPDNGSNVFDNTFFLGNDSFAAGTGGGNSNHANYNDPLWGGTDHEASQRRDYYTDGVKYASDGVTPDNNGKYFNNLTHVTLADEIQAYNGDLPSFGTAIGYLPGDMPPPSSLAGPFWGGMQFAEHYDAPFVNIKTATSGNQAAFQADMNAMADALVQAISYFNVFSLGETICDVNGNDDYTDETVTITVNGSVVDPSNYSINSQGNKIIFNQGFSWAGGANVQIAYLVCE